ncbi:MAG: hypothetical protein NC489_19480 [Ruminococcus flavefaciens]|nr:hypothetical protein [Ruminococcus flavefaciens]
MNNTSLNCSLNDTTKLRNLILENPELPLLVFCGEDSWHDEYPYEQADASSGDIKELTFYNGWWMDRGDYEDKLSDDLCDKEEYKNLSDHEYSKIIEQKIAETEFVKAIVIYVG